MSQQQERFGAIPIELSDIICCVQIRHPNLRCGGALIERGERLTCQKCSYEYPVIRGVATIKVDGDSPDNWFEDVYKGRSRDSELGSSYLSLKRIFMSKLVKSVDLIGPTLEIGCGIGLFADVVPNFVGLEYIQKPLHADGFAGFNRVCADAQTLPFLSEAIQCVFSFNTLEHVNDPELAFAEIDRVLMPGGYAVLKPAWNCTRYNTELIPVLGFGELNLRQKLTKLLLPLIRSKLYKLISRVPIRLWRTMTATSNNRLRWRKLEPYHGDLWISDADATASLDPDECILFFETRGYKCLSHRNAISKLLSGHDIVVLQKSL